MPKKETRKNQRKAVGAVSWDQPKTPNEVTDERTLKTQDWITFFQESKNTYPNNLAERSRRASTHHSILISKHVYTVGDGLIYANKDGTPYDGANADFEAFVDKVNAKGETLYEVFKKVAKDFIFFANADIQAIRTKVGESGKEKKVRVNIEHFDTTNIRLGKKNEQGIIEFVYFSKQHNWKKVTIKKYSDKQNQVVRLPVFVPGGKDKQSVLHITEYEPEFQYYGIPDYVGAMISIDIEYRIPKFNLDRLDNGFMPSALVQLIGDPPDGMKPEQYVKDFVKKFTGEGKTSKIVVELLDDKDQAAHVEIFDSIKEGDFTELQKLTTENIISAHRWFPAIAGLSIAGKLGSVQQILNEFEIAHATVIPGYRNAIIPPFNKLLREAGFDIRIGGVKNIMPISFISSITFDKIVEKNEARVRMGLDEKPEYDNQLIDDGETKAIKVE